MKDHVHYPVTLTPDHADGGFIVTFAHIPETRIDGIAAALRALAKHLDLRWA